MDAQISPQQRRDQAAALRQQADAARAAYDNAPALVEEAKARLVELEKVSAAERAEHTVRLNDMQAKIKIAADLARQMSQSPGDAAQRAKWQAAQDIAQAAYHEFYDNRYQLLDAIAAVDAAKKAVEEAKANVRPLRDEALRLGRAAVAAEHDAKFATLKEDKASAKEAKKAQKASMTLEEKKAEKGAYFAAQGGGNGKGRNFTAWGRSQKECEDQLDRAGFPGPGKCKIGGGCAAPDYQSAGEGHPPAPEYAVDWGACVQVNVPAVAGQPVRTHFDYKDTGIFGEGGAKFYCDLNAMNLFLLPNYDCKKDKEILSCLNRAQYGSGSVAGLVTYRALSSVGHREMLLRSYYSCVDYSYEFLAPLPRAGQATWEIPGKPGWKIVASGDSSADTGAGSYLLTPPDGRPAVAVSNIVANVLIRGQYERFAMDAAEETYSLVSSGSKAKLGYMEPRFKATNPREKYADILVAITNIYREVLGREPDVQGLSHWGNTVHDGQMTIEQVRATIEACHALPEGDPNRCN